MVMTDPIADMIVQIKAAILRKKEAVDMPTSSIKEKIAAVLKEEGFIKIFEILTKGRKKFLRLHLKYALDEYGKIKHSAITNMKRISTPGCRTYKKADEIYRVFSGFGLSIISTSRGLMTDKNARANGLGGEVLLNVW